MLEIKNFSIAGMHYDRSLLWVAAPEERLVAAWNTKTGEVEKTLAYQHEVWDVCPNDDGLWIVSGGGSLGRQLVLWSLEDENESFSPAAYRNELWLIEADPGPLGHWSESEQGKYFFSRYDPAREKIVERLPVAFAPSCMAYDGARFWYAERGKKGFTSTKRPIAGAAER
ncbi:MAG: hypothetical protein HYS67_02145 [Deltaproteobacteria bacterium]|nr:hypothetical protein [Deltaproteobacteria bacterium]